jgi:uncharacterized membrane protein
MKRHVISHVAIYLLSIVMAVFGIYHFMYPKEMMVYVPTFIPGGVIWVYFVGGAFILAAIAFIFNKKVQLAGYLLALLLLLFVFTIHLPTYLQGGTEETRHIALINLLKDTAIAAFALHIAGSADAKGIIF